MTSYVEKNGRMVAQHLPAGFGEDLALQQHPDLASWAARQHGKYTLCPKCQVAMPAGSFTEHFRTVHPKQSK